MKSVFTPKKETQESTVFFLLDISLSGCGNLSCYSHLISSQVQGQCQKNWSLRILLYHDWILPAPPLIFHLCEK